jgi:hypothetical protein
MQNQQEELLADAERKYWESENKHQTQRDRNGLIKDYFLNGNANVLETAVKNHHFGIWKQQIIHKIYSKREEKMKEQLQKKSEISSEVGIEEFT